MNTKSASLVLIAFFINFTLFAQSKEQYAKAKVSYGIEINFDKDQKKYKSLLEAFPNKAAKMETIASEFDFSLDFNDSTSLFYLEKKLYSDNSVAKLAIIFSGYYGRIKQQSSDYITENLQEDFGKFLVSRPHQEWEMHDETKTIGKYICFKATTSYSIISNGKVFKRNFTAWYAPELPYKYGPLGYGNLPGLIIELQGENFTYGVKKIEFHDEKEDSKKNKMPKLKKLKLITVDEFDKLAAEDEKRWRGKD